MITRQSNVVEEKKGALSLALDSPLARLQKKRLQAAASECVQRRSLSVFVGSFFVQTRVNKARYTFKKQSSCISNQTENNATGNTFPKNDFPVPGFRICWGTLGAVLP